MADETRDIAAADPNRSLADAGSLARLMADEYRQMVAYYAKEMSLGKAKAKARALLGADVDRVEQAPPSDIAWWTLGRVTEADPERAQAILQRLMNQARDELDSGNRSADAVGANGRPWDQARYLTILRAFAEDLRPRNAVEAQLIESAAEARFNQLSRTARHAALSANEAQRLSGEIRERGNWTPPTVDAAAAVDQAARMVDRFHQQFIRAIQALHSLRGGASTVTMGDVGQLNVAPSQINVAATDSTARVTDAPLGPPSSLDDSPSHPRASRARGSRQRTVRGSHTRDAGGSASDGRSPE